MGRKAQTRFEFWDRAVLAALGTTPEDMAKDAAVKRATAMADNVLKARDERAAFLLQRFPGENEVKAKAAAEAAAKAAAEAQAPADDDEAEEDAA
jgi:hypothetical protein